MLFLVACFLGVTSLAVLW